jgi:hypothetical protein
MRLYLVLLVSRLHFAFCMEFHACKQCRRQLCAAAAWTGTRQNSIHSFSIVYFIIVCILREEYNNIIA